MLDALPIINALDSKFPDNGVSINNLSDVYLGAHVGMINQFIFGLTPSDPGENAISHYRTRMEKIFGKKEPDLTVWGWPFDDYDLADAEMTLQALSDHFGVELDIRKMIGDLRIGKPEGKSFFLAVTINQISVFAAG